MIRCVTSLDHLSVTDPPRVATAVFSSCRSSVDSVEVQKVSLRAATLKDVAAIETVSPARSMRGALCASFSPLTLVPVRGARAR